MVPLLSAKYLGHNSSQKHKKNEQASRTEEFGKGNVHSLRKFTASVCGNEVWALPSIWTVAQLIEYRERAHVKAAETEPDDSQPHGFHPIKWKWSIPSWGASAGEDCGCGHKIVTGEWFSNYSNNGEWEGLPACSEMPCMLWPQSHF